MKKKVIFILAGILVVGLIGSHRLEPERRVYPLAMGFEVAEDEYQVFYDIPDLSVYTGDGKPMEESDRIWSFRGNGNKDIEQEIARSKKETPDMGHVQAIILGSNLLADSMRYGEVLESFMHEPMLGSGSYMFYSKDLEKVMTASAKQTDSLGEYLVDLIDKSPDKNPVILQDLYNAYFNQEELPELMEVLVENEKLAVNGLDSL